MTEGVDQAKLPGWVDFRRTDSVVPGGPEKQLMFDSKSQTHTPDYPEAKEIK